MSTTNTIIKENLIKIKELIKDPAHWTQDVFARDAAGLHISPFSEKAVCFCLVGAIEKVVYSDSNANKDFSLIPIELDRIMHSIRNTISIMAVTPIDSDDCRISTYNDEHTHAEVIALLDKAIASCE